MSVRPILKLGNPILNQKSLDVPFVSSASSNKDGDDSDGCSVVSFSVMPSRDSADSAAPRDDGEAALKQLVADMLITMKDANGAGLAAPQIGVLKRVMIFGAEKKNPRYPNAELVPMTVLINPTFEVTDPTPCEFFEGCLSVPGLRGAVSRPSAVRYRGYDVSGKKIERDASGFHCRVFLHELDHLDGVLFPQRVTDFTKFGFTDELEERGLVPSVGAGSPAKK